MYKIVIPKYKMFVTSNPMGYSRLESNIDLYFNDDYAWASGERKLGIELSILFIVADMNLLGPCPALFDYYTVSWIELLDSHPT